MFDIDKKAFGYFISELRKEKGYTQKELAQKLFVSDKAVSKWECGLSMPDITLLVPLSKILDVTVTELLECKRMDNVDQIEMDKVNEIVNKAIQCSEEKKQADSVTKKRMKKAFIICVIISCMEIILSLAIGITIEQIASQNILLFLILALVFGIWFCFFAKETLPVCYDEHNLSYYSDGFFQFSLIGVHFNNSNWQYILQTGRIWSMATLIIFPLLGLILNMVLSGDILILVIISCIGLVLDLGGFFIPMYVVAKKYQ